MRNPHARSIEAPTTAKPLVLVALLLAAFVVNVDTTIVNVALPTLVRRLHTSNSQLQWVVDAFNLLFAGAVLAAGSLSDRLGRKGMLLCGLAVFGLASLAGGFMDSSGALIAARAVMGFGAAMVFPSTLSMLTNEFRGRRERALAIGLWGATTGMAIALGPIIGGALIQIFDWRSVFFAITPIAAAASVLVVAFVPSSRGPRGRRIDLTGFVLSTATVGLCVYTIIEAPNHGWGSARTLVCFAVTAALLLIFVAWERHTEEPMLDVRLFSDLRFSAASASVAISFFALSGFIFLVTQYFQFLKGYGPLSSGVRLLPVAMCVAASSILGTRLAVKVGTKLVVTAGLLLTAGFYLWVTTASPTTSYLTIALQMVVMGTGMGLTSAPATEAIMGVVPVAKAGVGSAVNDATRLTGGTLGVAIIGSVYASLFSSRLTGTLPAQLLHALARAAHSSIGAALTVSDGLARGGHGALADALRVIATNAFMHGMHGGDWVAGGISIGGAVLAFVLLPAHPAASPDAAPEPYPTPVRYRIRCGPNPLTTGSTASPPLEEGWNALRPEGVR